MAQKCPPKKVTNSNKWQYRHNIDIITENCWKGLGLNERQVKAEGIEHR